MVSVSFDRSVRVWDIRKGNYIFISSPHRAEINACDTYGSNLVMTASDDKTSILLDTRMRGQIVHVFEDHTHWVTSCSLQRRYNSLSGSTDGTVRLYDLRNFKVIQPS